MRNSINILISMAALFIFTGCSNPAMTSKAKSTALKAGFAVRVINPIGPAIPLGHKDATNYTEVHADLRVQAMAIEDDADNRIILLGWDNVFIKAEMIDQVKEIVKEKYNIAPESFCINSSHSHSTPAMTGKDGDPIEKFNPEYADLVINAVIDVVGEAISNLTPAKLSYSDYMCTSVAINRRKPPTYFITPYVEGTVDHKVQIVKAESLADGKLLGLIAEYACHPVTVSLIGLGSDYPGFMREFVEARHPDAVVVFLQGCGGNIRIQIVDDDVTKFTGFSVEMAKKFGTDLGMSVEWAINAPGQSVVGPIEAEYTEIELPSKKEPGATVPYRIQAFRLGAGSNWPFTLVALQGEVFIEYGLNLQKALQPANTIVLGYSNHSRGYICTAEGIEEGGYECPKCPVTGAAESMILQAATELARP
ncbi:MAG: neutral/alkaline non-lysosomal ceramidase N-terminal domain-containing protein [Planctomycetes bacterium]|nr:neutral/alkaline non-lysosomal ceramidase N-terminal domain-containing protein [Planctomycetota bacterium]